MQPLLSISDLSVDFSSDGNVFHAVKKISFSVEKGEIVAVVGESGSGKSVTALSILKLLPVPPARYPEGRILFTHENKSIDLLQATKEELLHIRGNKIAMIFQEPMSSLNPVMTCGKQVAESLQLHKKISGARAKREVINWFRQVKLPEPEMIFHRYPHQLSGGQKQRVMIAMAMCCQPDLLICDEPTTALDVTVQKTILELIKDLQEETGMGVIFITHDLGVVAEIADRTMVMYKGEIIEHGPANEIFSSPRQPYTQALLACRPANQKRGKRLPVVSDFLGENKPGKSINTDSPDDSKLPSSTKEILLEVKNLVVEFPAKKNLFGKPLSFLKAVDRVSFDVYKGETLGLVGESGCGKTTLGRALLRLINPSAGQILFRKTDLVHTDQKKLQDLRKEIQIIFQDPFASLNPRLTIGAAIAEPMAVHGILKKEKERRDAVVNLLEKVGLRADHYNRYPHEFSGGQRQRLVIARALALNPGFIVCDESVSALDVSVQAQVLNLLNDLKKEYGFTVVFISHDLSVVRYISDRIMVMHKGKILEIGPSDTIFYSPATDYTRQLIQSIPGKITV